MEEWRAIPGFDNYEVSDIGSVRSVPHVMVRKNGSPLRVPGQVLRTHDFCGYRRVGLRCGGQTHTQVVHRLVMLAFVGPCPPGYEVCHGNADRSDNRLANLRYGTRSDNQRDRVLHGNHEKRNRVKCPQRHLLVEPNLVAAKLAKGHRVCLACNRAHVRRHKAAAAGRPVADLQSLSDGFYEKIMA